MKSVLLLTLLFFNLAHATEKKKFLVKFKNESFAENFFNNIAPSNVNLVKTFDEIKVHLVEVSNVESLRSLDYMAEELKEQIEFLEEDATLYAIAEPNDKDLKKQSTSLRIGLKAAWDLAKGSRDIVVAVSDSGVQMDHEDLAGNMWINQKEIPGNGLDDDNNGFIDDINGWDFVQKDNYPQDDNGHGTHVAGIIGAVGNNSIGVAGVNWNVRIMPVRFLNSAGSGSTSDGLATILYAANNGARILNASWGGGPKSPSLESAIEYAYNKGMLVIAAAGNSGMDNDKTPHYPSSADSFGMLAVASSSSIMNLSGFSNYGATSVDVVAPGSDIYSTYTGNTYRSLSGTSMASPIVAGLGALILSIRPDLSAKDLKNALMNATTITFSDKVAAGGEVIAPTALIQLNEEFQVWPKTVALSREGFHHFTAYRPSGKVTWSLSPSNLGSIDSNGLFKASGKEGSVVITARDSSGMERVSTVKLLAPPAQGGGGGCSAYAGNGEAGQSVDAGLIFMLIAALAFLAKKRLYRKLRN